MIASSPLATAYHFPAALSIKGRQSCLRDQVPGNPGVVDDDAIVSFGALAAAVKLDDVRSPAANIAPKMTLDRPAEGGSYPLGLFEVKPPNS